MKLQAGQCWPINEIVLRAYLWRGVCCREIARLHHVRLDDVVILRDKFGI